MGLYRSGSGLIRTHTHTAAPRPVRNHTAVIGKHRGSQAVVSSQWCAIPQWFPTPSASVSDHYPRKRIRETSALSYLSQVSRDLTSCQALSLNFPFTGSTSASKAPEPRLMTSQTAPLFRGQVDGSLQISRVCSIRPLRWSVRKDSVISSVLLWMGVTGQIVTEELVPLEGGHRFFCPCRDGERAPAFSPKSWSTNPVIGVHLMKD